jgi:hypothetical protein
MGSIPAIIARLVIKIRAQAAGRSFNARVRGGCSAIRLRSAKRHEQDGICDRHTDGMMASHRRLDIEGCAREFENEHHTEDHGWNGGNDRQG